MTWIRDEGAVVLTVKRLPDGGEKHFFHKEA